jgi:hypothetical protein
MESNEHDNRWACQILKFIIVFGSKHSNFPILRYVQRLGIPDEQKNISSASLSEMKTDAN